MLIKRLKVVHFKSIKHLDFSCSRVNLLIGEPNTGKSNILEALGLVSWLQHIAADQAAFNPQHAYEWLRVRRGEQLFYFRDTSRKVEIRLEIEDEEGKTDRRYAAVEGRKDGFAFFYSMAPEGFPFLESDANLMLLTKRWEGPDAFIKFYRYPATLPAEEKAGVSFLLPPIGRNLSEVLLDQSNPELTSAVRELLEPAGFRLVFKTGQHEYQMELDEVRVVTFEPYLVSDTLRRMLFHTAAVLSNKNCVVTLEEPEAHAFPDYLISLAEQIARSNNQFFITTHSPEVVYTLAKETPKGEFACFVATTDKERGTTVTPIPYDTVLSYGTDILANIDDFLKE